MKKFKIVVLLSGNGSTLQAIIDRIKANHWPIEIAAVISDRADAYGLTRATQASIPTYVLPPKTFADKQTYHLALQECIDNIGPDLIVLAGYMRILTPEFVTHFANKIINIHPSLLPKFPGMHTHQRVLEAGETEHGTSVHIVTAELDAGPLLAQARTSIDKQDTAESIEKKIKALEAQLYPEVIYKIASGKIKLIKKTYFISDLHLDQTAPAITRCFIDFLQNQGSTAEAIYILGDFFERWIGDDEKNSLTEQVAAALKKLSMNGIKLYFMCGNRDFLLGKKYAQACGMEILKDPTVLNLYGKKILLMHGDLLCTDDLAYQRFRRLAHNPLFKILFLALPLFIRRRIADKAREKSRRYTQTANLKIQDVNQTTVEHYLSTYHVDCLIHGHTHRSAIHDFRLHGKPARRIVLDAWHEHGNALCFQSSGEIDFINFNYFYQPPSI
jgi:UDP-2,3-diacylglucosamine hydrolase